jgi:hypothetical protein
MTLHLKFCSSTSPLSKSEQRGPWGKPEFDLRPNSGFAAVFLSQIELWRRKNGYVV